MGSNWLPKLAVAIAAIGGGLFLAWRRTAPVSRRYLRRQREKAERERREPNPQRNPGTRPI